MGSVDSELGDEIIQSEAAKSALRCSSDHAARVPCYCEENVWRVAYRHLHRGEKLNVDGSGRQRYYAVFVSNPTRCCPMWSQRAVDDPNDPIFWDYHVILIGRYDSTGETLVYDIDTNISLYPCPIGKYLCETFREECIHRDHQEQLAPRFRVIRAQLYLKHFCSDRLHMFDKDTGKWNATPPTYECIKRKKDPCRSNLDYYIDMVDTGPGSVGSGEDGVMGEVLSLDALRRRFSPRSHSQCK